jgi:type IV fimbrial biogenesis protein FimT
MKTHRISDIRFRIGSHRGFTLLELIVTVAVVAIAAAIAVPNLADFARNNAMSSATNDLLHALQVARAEATKRQVNTVWCASANPRASTPTCTNTGIKGWIVYLDNNTNNNWAHESTEEVIETYELSPKIFLVADRDAIASYGATGFANPAGAKSPSTAMVLCDSRGNQTNGTESSARGITVGTSGRAGLTRLVSDITVMLDSGKINSTCPP